MSDYREKCDACGNYHECNPCEFCAALEANRAAPPPANDELRAVAKQWREDHIGHILDSKELGEGGEDEDALFDDALTALLAQVAARARADEHARTCVACGEGRGFCKRGAELQKAVQVDP